MTSFTVSTNGNDATGDGSAGNPFATLQRAQAAMQASAIKTTIVEGGVYDLSSTLALGAQDDGETFMSAPGQTATLDGGGSLATLISLTGTSGVSLDGLGFENTAVTSGLSTGAISLTDASGTSIVGNSIQGAGSDAILMIGSTGGMVSDNRITSSARNGIEDQDGGSGNSFTGNTIDGVGATNTNGGGIFLHGTDRETISHNLVENLQGSGITLESIGGFDGASLLARNTNTTISDNLIRNSSQNSKDAGGIYVLDRTDQNTGIVIDNNEVDGSGVGSYVGGIYLDDDASGVAVTDNIVRGIYARDAQLHGGHDDVFSNNIFDLGNTTGFGVLFQSSNITPNGGVQPATNNQFTHNILISTETNPDALINLNLSPSPAVAGNLYYDPNAAFTGVLDSAPQFGNPDFVDAAGNDYALQPGSAASGIGFVPIDQGAIGPVGGGPPVSVGSGPDAIVLVVSEDYYLADAQFTVSVDGQKVGGLLTTTAIRSQDQTQAFTLNGTFAPGPHTVAVDFTNDAYAGTAATDRNLYVDTIAYGGTTTVENAAQLSAGTVDYVIPGGPAGDQLVVDLSEDAYQGDARADILVDGNQVGGPVTVTALHGSGATQAFAIDGTWGSGPHTVGVTFLNDAYGGTATTDRNLYIDAVSDDGNRVAVGTVQATDGTTNVAVQGGAPLGSGPDQLVLDLTEDAYQGDARAVILVDGHQVAGPVTVTALHAAGQSQVVAIDGAWGSGQHTVGVAFINDAYGGTAATDRNLYVTGASYDGTLFSENITELSNGTRTLTVSGGLAALAATVRLGPNEWMGPSPAPVAGGTGRMLAGGTLDAMSASALHAGSHALFPS